MSENVMTSDNVTGTESSALIERWDSEYNYLFLIYLVVPYRSVRNSVRKIIKFIYSGLGSRRRFSILPYYVIFW